ncbi:heme biosynthesis protein HemY [Roseobacter sinensis]|uniref:Tetratricopeptide repeat protein n=1 Tax=Roseobacter sinensis TaxID=2931391 RepID=A0ABT3B8W1_9RHOB|nr:heme biosynthesis HemY N-terminal domain-containing protein [Roseobacter sp. WL0113]MCV3269973.1 tetratricopeptide repeat protein [Roseobacter sp. WL0113]
MLWSLIKIILFVGVVAALALGAGYLLESQGGVQVTVMGSEYTFGPLQSVIAVVVLVVAVWILLKLLSLLLATWHFLNGDETALSRYFDRNRERKGFDALSEGMMALASGEGRVAMAKAAKADRYLKKPELTNLLTAQAAEMAGDRRKAEETYKKLVTNDATRFVGVRGILKQKLADGDTETALKLAEKAFAIKPKHEEVQDLLLRLQAKKEDWAGARQTLSAKLKYGSLPRDVHKRRDAVLALSEAKDILNADTSIDTKEKAIEANKLSPDLIPAAVMAAQSYIEKGKPRYATRIIKKAWETMPHPDLAAAFAEIEPEETPGQRIKRFALLTRINPQDPETRMLLAELHIANEDFPEARRALGDLVETDPTARSVTLMAAIERGEGADDAVVRGWLARALTVSRGPQWICDNCQHIHAEWAPTCENCESFDTLTWKTPPMSEVAMPGGVQMLPLIVGAIEDQTKTASDPAPEAEETVEDAELLDAEEVPPEETPAEEEKRA